MRITLAVTVALVALLGCQQQPNFEQLLPRELAFRESDVESRAKALRIKNPEYPRRMREAGVGALFSVAFVVDTSGQVDIATLRVVSGSPESAFVDAVRDALRAAKFKPAAIGTRKVRQWMIGPWEFDVRGTP